MREIFLATRSALEPSIRLAAELLFLAHCQVIAFFSMIRQAAKNSGLLPRNLRVSSRLSSRCFFLGWQT